MEVFVLKVRKDGSCCYPIENIEKLISYWRSHEVVYTFIANNWNDAMERYYNYMDYGEYIPMGDDV